MVRLLPVSLLLLASVVQGQDPYYRDYDTIQEAPQEAFGTWDRYELLRRARETFQRYDSPTWNRMYAWRVMNPNPFGPSVTQHLRTNFVSLGWEGVIVKLDLNSGTVTSLHVAPHVSKPDKNAIRPDDEVGAVALAEWQSFYASSGPEVDVMYSTPQRGIRSVSFFPRIGGSPYSATSAIGGADVSLRDLSIVLLSRGKIPPHRPGHVVKPEPEVRQAVLAAFRRYLAWRDVSLEFLEPKWGRPVNSNGIFVSELDPGQEQCSRDGVVLLWQEVVVNDNASYDPATGKFSRYVVAYVDAVQGNVMSFFPAYRLAYQARGAESGRLAGGGPVGAFEPSRAEALLAGGASLPLGTASLRRIERTAKDAPFGRPLALLRDHRARYGVLCAEGLLWLPEGGAWQAWRLAPEVRKWAGRNAPHLDRSFGKAVAPGAARSRQGSS